MTERFNRKSFVTKIGAAGLGLGLMASSIGASPVAKAQDASTPTPSAAPGSAPGEGDFGKMRAELYGEFTAALATELGNTSSDKVDAAIRKAMMTVIDSHVADNQLSSGQAEALKVLVATADSPIAPGFMFMGGPGMMGPGMMGHGPMGHGGEMWGHGCADGRMGPGRAGERGGMKGGDDNGGDWSSQNNDDSYGDEAKQAANAGTPTP